jgi:hypothetical protein
MDKRLHRHCFLSAHFAELSWLRLLLVLPLLLVIIRHQQIGVKLLAQAIIGFTPPIIGHYWQLLAIIAIIGCYWLLFFAKSFPIIDYY